MNALDLMLISQLASYPIPQQAHNNNPAFQNTMSQNLVNNSQSLLKPLETYPKPEDSSPITKKLKMEDNYLSLIPGLGNFGIAPFPHKNESAQCKTENHFCGQVKFEEGQTQLQPGHEHNKLDLNKNQPFNMLEIPSYSTVESSILNSLYLKAQQQAQIISFLQREILKVQERKNQSPETSSQRSHKIDENSIQELLNSFHDEPSTGHSRVRGKSLAMNLKNRLQQVDGQLGNQLLFENMEKGVECLKKGNGMLPERETENLSEKEDLADEEPKDTEVLKKRKPPKRDDAKEEIPLKEIKRREMRKIKDLERKLLQYISSKKTETKARGMNKLQMSKNMQKKDSSL